LLSFYAFAEKTDNDIVNDYFDNLQRIENETQSFKTKPIGERDRYEWQGFYMYLETKLDIDDWDFVNNPSGGFLGIHWGWRKLRDVRVYLQIAQDKLCFKVEDFDHNRERALGLHETISKLAVAEVVNEVVPPSRIRMGDYTTFAVVEHGMLAR